MKKLIIIILLTPSLFFSQTKDELDLCMAIQGNSFSSNVEAEKALQRILDVIGASKNFVLTPCDKISNAVATAYKGTRYILYDKAFMELISKNTNDWSNLFIFAHEVGHHINGHSIDILLYAGDVVDSPSLDKKRQQELEADEFAAFIVSKLGAGLTEITETLAIISSNEDDTYSTHPKLSKRILAVKKGFERAFLFEEKNKTSSESKPSKIVLKSTSPREPIIESYDGIWKTIISFPKEQEIDNEIFDDPFLRNKLDESSPNISKYSEAPIECLSPYGKKYSEKENLNWFNGFRYTNTIGISQSYNEDGRLRYFDYDSDGNIKRVLKDNIVPNKYFKISLNIADLKNIRIPDKNVDEDCPVFAVFEFLVDNELIGKIPFSINYKMKDLVYDEPGHTINPDKNLDNKFQPIESFSSPVLCFFENFQHQQKLLYQLIEAMKKGNKLYFRLDGIYYYWGFKDETFNDFDLSKKYQSLEITDYNYEVNLKGSSKALSFMVN